jgi:pimeloyl-ACP methyl ester carboxylesterase
MVTIENMKINYICVGEGENVLVLHGWGANIDTVMPIVNLLKDHFKVYALDMPGFGKSDKPDVPFDSQDYCRIVKKFMDLMKIEKATLIGHSFGGKVSILTAVNHPERVERLVLIDSAGIRPKRSLKYYLRVYSFKTLKLMYKIIFSWNKNSNRMEKLYKRFGSTDYRNASGVMRRTLVKVINEDLKSILNKVSCPALLIWGDEDKDTPLYMGRIMEKEIPDSGLVILEGAGHYSYLDDYYRFTLVLRAFLINKDSQ